MVMPAVKTSTALDRVRSLRLALTPVVVALAILSACSSHKKGADAKDAAAKAGTANAGSGGFMTGSGFGPKDSDAKFVTPGSAAPANTAVANAAPADDAPKFSVPKSTGKGAPDLASVPTKAPKTPSTRQEREKATEGLIADRDHARYADQGGRTVPVVVRPLTEAQAAPDEPAAPPKPQAAQVGSVTRLGNQPAAAEGASEAAKTAAVASAAQMAATAKAPAPPPEIPAGPRPSNVPTARTDGFRPLGTYEPVTSVSNQVASVDFAGTGTSITAAGRRALSEAAKLGERTKGPFRVIGRASTPSNIVQDRATAVARELQRLGVAQDRIFVGTDIGQEGRVDVILDQ